MRNGRWKMEIKKNATKTQNPTKEIGSWQWAVGNIAYCQLLTAFVILFFY